MVASKNLSVQDNADTVLAEIVKNVRIAVFAGLPGVGKSLLVKRLASLAVGAGRKVTNLQWDVARRPFETPEWLCTYPEIDGVTHRVIRKGVGRWARGAILNWCKSDDGGLLVCEAPIVGNRFQEITQVREDLAEEVLADPQTLFVIPVPSPGIRKMIETARAHTQGNPRNQYEVNDASVEVIQKLWVEVFQLANSCDCCARAGIQLRKGVPYDPEVYASAYQHILRHRRSIRLNIDQDMTDQDSVYDFGVTVHNLSATETEAQQIMARLASKHSSENLEQEAEDWFTY